jgi:ABC-2 type transport system ATP-binding protein
MTLRTPNPIDVQNLSARYGRVPVLDDITLTVRPGETLGVVGLAGAGKTTLLKSILMQMAPTAGQVHLFGVPHRLPQSRARLAYLPERFQPPGHLFGHDFLRLTLAFYRRHADRDVARWLADRLDLDPAALDRPVRDYSESMAQKLGLLAALMTDLPLLILDEPMSGLDPEGRLRLKQQLAARRARGHSILSSWHILADHDELFCDRVAVLHRGRLVWIGPPAELKARQGEPTLEAAFLAEIDAAEPAVPALGA